MTRRDTPTDSERAAASLLLALQSRAQHLHAQDGAHLDAEAIAAFAEHRGDPVQKKFWKAHLAQCPDCYALLLELVQEQEQQPQHADVALVAKQPWWRSHIALHWRWAAGTLTSVMLVAGIYYLLPNAQKPSMAPIADSARYESAAVTESRTASASPLQTDKADLEKSPELASVHAQKNTPATEIAAGVADHADDQGARAGIAGAAKTNSTAFGEIASRDENVSITGSRIKRSDVESAAPVVVAETAALQAPLVQASPQMGPPPPPPAAPAPAAAADIVANKDAGNATIPVEPQEESIELTGSRIKASGCDTRTCSDDEYLSETISDWLDSALAACREKKVSRHDLEKSWLALQADLQKRRIDIPLPARAWKNDAVFCEWVSKLQQSYGETDSE